MMEYDAGHRIFYPGSTKKEGSGLLLYVTNPQVVHDLNTSIAFGIE